MGWDETEEELEWEELEWEVSFRLVSDKYNDVTAPHCTFPSCIFLSQTMDSLPFTDSQSDYDDYDEFDFDEDDAFGYYEALLSSDESLAEVPDSQLPSPSPTQV